MKITGYHERELLFLRHFSLFGKISIIFLSALMFAACGSIRQGQVPDGKINAKNGERIYFTATSDRGSQITFRGGPRFGGMMMGSFLTCAACHGPDGRGGTHWMHMQVMEAPDIRFEKLVEETAEHGGAEFGLEDFRQVVVEGLHPDGETISRDMPRWQMSEADLEDLFAFIQILP